MWQIPGQRLKAKTKRHDGEESEYEVIRINVKQEYNDI